MGIHAKTRSKPIEKELNETWTTAQSTHSTGHCKKDSANTNHQEPPRASKNPANTQQKPSKHQAKTKKTKKPRKTKNQKPKSSKILQKTHQRQAGKHKQNQKKQNKSNRKKWSSFSKFAIKPMLHHQSEQSQSRRMTWCFMLTGCFWISGFWDFLCRPHFLDLNLEQIRALQIGLPFVP